VPQEHGRWPDLGRGEELGWRRSATFIAVMLALVASIYVLIPHSISEDVDGRHEADHDGNRGAWPDCFIALAMAMNRRHSECVTTRRNAED
ncbi:MAG: hypothetical protein LCH80_01330, partial [Proteobacteria bacterium]|nr:hypothetical protein [Pseudomonadota bacterium]